SRVAKPQPCRPHAWFINFCTYSIRYWPALGPACIVRPHRIDQLGRLFARARDLVMLDGKAILRYAFALGLNDMGRRLNKSHRSGTVLRLAQGQTVTTRALKE